MSKEKKSTGGSSKGVKVKNYYEAVPKKHRIEERTYDNHDALKLDIPFRMCLAGKTGSGKTNVVMNVIDTIREFDKILLFAKDLSEPLYATLIDVLREAEKKTNQSILTTSKDLDNLPEVDSHDRKLNTLLIVDDMISEKKNKLYKLEPYATMGRHFNVSLMFLTQDYFKAPITIRKNCEYIVLNKITTNRDLKTIVKDFDLNTSDEQIQKMYDASTKEGFPNFFMVDNKTKDPKYRFRKQWDPIDVPQIEGKGAEVKESPLKKIKFHHKEEEESSDDDGSVEEDDKDVESKSKERQEKHDRDTEGEARHDSLLHQFEDEAERVMDEIRTHENQEYTNNPYYTQLLSRLEFLQGQIENLAEEKRRPAPPKNATKLSKKGTIPERLRMLSATTGYPITELKRAAKMMSMPLSQYLKVLENM